MSLGPPRVPESQETTRPSDGSGTTDAASADEAVGTGPADGGQALWMPLRSWTQADPSRWVLVWAVVLLAVQAAFRGFVMFGGWFLYDDLSFIERAATQPLWSTEYLLTSWNGHVMPGAFVWVHVLTSLWPLEYTPVAISGLVAQALAGVAMYALLVELFGRRPAVLVPLTFYLFSAITLPATLWWAAALNQLPGVAALTLALWGQVRYHRTGQLRYGVVTVLAVVGGLLFSEKVILAVPVLFLLSLLYFTAGPPWTRVKDCLKAGAPVWSALGAVTLVYAAYYLVAVPSPVNGEPNAVVALKTMGHNLIYAVAPALYGGPFTWQQLGVGAVASPPTAVVVLSAVTTALLIAWSVARRHRAVFGWLVIAGYWAVNTFILGMTRAPWVGPVIGQEYRYATDLAVVLTVFGSLAVLPLHGTWQHGRPQLLLPRRRAVTDAVPRGLAPSGLTEPVVAGALSIAFVVSALITTMAFDAPWRNEVTPRFFDTVRTDLASLPERVTMVDLILPDTAAPSAAVFGTTAHTAVAAMPNRPTFLEPGEASHDLWIIGDDGHVRQAWVDGFRNVDGPEPGCGWRVGQDPVTVPLVGSTMDWRWYVQVDYIASLEADTTISAGSVETPVHIEPGAHRLFLMSDGPVDSVRFGGLTYGSLCTDSIAVGFPKPLVSPSP